jgi:hypothetical protein
MIHRVRKMMNSNMRQTIFSIDKLKNVVNIGRCSAYQIYTIPGEQLGTIGTIVNPGTSIPANDKKILTKTENYAKESVSTSWFTRALAALKS